MISEGIMKTTLISLLLFGIVIAPPTILAAGQTSKTQKATAATNPTSCITSAFNKTGDSNWYSISLKLTNQCGQDVNFQNANVTFQSADNLNTNFWGNFAPLTYPDNALNITSQSNGVGSYLASFSLHFPEESWANTILKNGQSITINYGSTFASYNASSVKVYVGGTPVQSGQLDLINNTSKPANISQAYATVDVSLNNQIVSKIQVPWSGHTVTSLNPATYTLTPEDITDTQGNQYHGNAVPVNVSVGANQTVNSVISYSPVIKQGVIKVGTSALPSEISGYTSAPIVSLTPGSGSAVTKSIAWGTTTAVSGLDLNVTYALSTPTIVFNGYQCTGTFNPASALSNTATAAPTVQLAYQCVRQVASAARIMAYVPGWKTPPPATSLATAGYTHALIAFGVFSTTQPGNIVSAFDTVTKAYIDSLHSAGMKAMLSLGGASTSVSNTSVDFHQVLSLASSPDVFQTTFVNSLMNLVTQYGFDGVDFDIEQGLGVGGTFANPTGDIRVLANIINTLHNNNPSLLISLAPQVANISATSGFDATWGNYASLIMQTHSALSWVGIQIYNTGCAYGIDHVCYADDANSPNLSVAMATDLLENWPLTDAAGRSTGFQPYISYLQPSQVVLGYPAPNSRGVSDGLPAKPTTVIKRAIKCLKTATLGSDSCDTYVPPRAYSTMGGVFEWEATYDQDNNFKFATDLKGAI